MIQLVYTSRARSPMSQDAILDILRVSRANNAADGLTGVLLYHRDHFFQVLEGPEAAVNARFARIERDPRHDRVALLLRDSVAARQFGGWSMGFAPAGELPADARDSFVGLLAQPQVANQLVAPSMVRVLLKTFAMVGAG
ncbi:MAG TPA: BLUF domain-containing protein [Herpetosiphonaceae bacterium]